jgi:hypothetical protein
VEDEDARIWAYFLEDLSLMDAVGLSVDLEACARWEGRGWIEDAHGAAEFLSWHSEGDE